MPVPQKFITIWGEADAKDLYDRCVSKARELGIEARGKYDEYSF